MVSSADEVSGLLTNHVLDGLTYTVGGEDVYKRQLLTKVGTTKTGIL